MTMPVSGLKSVEIIEEATFGTTPPNGDWDWVGLVDKYGTPLKKDTESFLYLPDHDDKTGLSKKRTQVKGGTLEATLNYYIQNFDFWKYAMGNASTLASSLPSFSVSETIEQTDESKRYIVAVGNIVKSIKLTLAEEGIGHVDTSIVRIDVGDPTDTDPTGVSGTHASEDLSDAYMWEEATDICMDANNPPTTAMGHILGDLNLELVNNFDTPKDATETTWTKIAGIILHSRDINLGMHLTLADVNDTVSPKLFDIVKNSTLQNLRFTLGDRIALITNLLFTEFDPSLAPEELIGHEFRPETDNADFILAYKMGYAYAYVESGTVYTDETAKANSTTENDMTLLPAAPATSDAYYFGRVNEKFSTLQLNIGTPGEGTWTVDWEYWSGAAWTACVGIVDGTSGFTAAAGWHDVTHTVQANWAQTDTVNSTNAYWIRANVSAFTSITTQPKGTQCWVYGE